jgi:hypothetical protein
MIHGRPAQYRRPGRPYADELNHLTGSEHYLPVAYHLYRARTTAACPNNCSQGRLLMEFAISHHMHQHHIVVVQQPKTTEGCSIRRKEHRRMCVAT